MNKVRQGILSRPLKDNYGRNNTTLETQFKKETDTQEQKKQLLNNIHEHRRAAFDGSRNERHELQNNQKSEIDFLGDAKKCFSERNQKLNEFENAKNYQHFLEGKRREEQARAAKREYQRQMMGQNRKMIEEKGERQTFEKQLVDLKEREMLQTDFNKKSYDYR